MAIASNTHVPRRRWFTAALIAVGLLAALGIAYFVRKHFFGLSSQFRQEATPAYIALIRMANTAGNVTGVEYQKARVDAEASLAEASPSVSTDADREAYLSLRHLLESQWEEDAREQMLRQQPELNPPAVLIAFDQDRKSACWAVLKVYFDPAGKQPSKQELRKSKQHCAMEITEYLKQRNGTAMANP